MDSGDACANLLINSLPAADRAQLASLGEIVSLAQGATLCQARREISTVYFPLSGIASLFFVMQNDDAIETAVVGREGVVGAMAGLGFPISIVRAIVQIPMEALRIPVADFRRLTQGNRAITNLCIRYNEILLTQTRIAAACNARHSIEARLCRWLLQASDRAGHPTLNLTQQRLSEMLGVHRNSVTSAAAGLQAAGAITYSRGNIEILKRETLKAMSCECYVTPQQLASG